MATRSFIARETKFGYEGVYCHWDGYLEGVGTMLQEHYRNPDKLALLLDHGDVSSLGAEIGDAHDFMDRDGLSTTFYGRDRGEVGRHTKPRRFRKLHRLLSCAAGMGCEYVYLFEMSTTNWFFCDRGAQYFGLDDRSKFSNFQLLEIGMVAA